MENKLVVRISFLITAIIFFVFQNCVHALTIDNPGFESWTAGSPDGWTVSKNFTDNGYGTNSYGIAQDANAYGGSASARTSLSSTGGGALSSNTYYFQKLTGAEAGNNYSFSYKYKYYTNGGGTGYALGLSMAAGIDPAGGTDPYSSNIIWTNAEITGFWPHESGWNTLSVTAPAASSEVTVFLKSNNRGRANEGQYDDITGLYVYGNFVNETYMDSAEINPVPEPATILLFGAGLGGFSWFRRFGKGLI